MDGETLLWTGGAVKALGNGRVGGYLVTFSDGTRKDVSGEWFTDRTYLGPDDGNGRDCLFDHGIPLKAGLEEFADYLFAPIKTRRDKVGIWAETALEMADEYEAMVYELAKAGRLGWSSGSAPHLVKRAETGEILRWPIVEGSLTPMPCEPLNRAQAVKSYAAVRNVAEVLDAVKVVWSSAYVNDLPDSAFLYIADGGKKDDDGKTTPRSLRYFPVYDKDGKLDEPHLRNALARIPQAKISAGAKKQAIEKAKKLAKKTDIEVSDKSIKGAFEDRLAEQVNPWSLIQAFCSAIRDFDIQEDAAELIGQQIDIEGLVDEAVASLAARLKEWAMLSLTEEEAEEAMPYMMSMAKSKLYEIVKGGLPAGLPFKTHSERVLAAAQELGEVAHGFSEVVQEWIKRGKDVKSWRASRKAGRTHSAATLEKFTSAKESLQAAMDAMMAVMENLDGMLTEGEPKPESDATARARQLKARLLRSTISLAG